MARVVPMPKTPLRGNAAVAVKRGLWRAGYIKGPALRFTPVFGPFAKLALKRYQRYHQLANVGTYTVPTHKHLARHMDAFAVWLLTKKPKPEPTLRVRPIRVRATVNLPGLKLGQVAWVDPNEPYIAKCLKKQLVVPVGGEEPGSVAHSEARMGEKA